MGAHPLLGVFELNPIKLAYNPSRPDGRLLLTASVFNRLGQCANSPELAVSSLAVPVTIVSTHYA